MKKAVKRIIIGIGILVALVIGSGVAFACIFSTPNLEREVGALEELLPKGAESYIVAADFAEISKLYKGSELGRQAKKVGVQKDFYSLRTIEKIEKKTHGRFWDILGKRFIYAQYGKNDFLLISQPKWTVKLVWKTILAKGEEKNISGFPCAVDKDGLAILFAGDYFWLASSENLLAKAAKIAASTTLKEKIAFPNNENNASDALAYGLTYNHGKYLIYSQARWRISKDVLGIKACVEFDNPSGVLGSYIAKAKPPRDYKIVPADVICFIKLTGVNAYKAWKEAGLLSVKKNNPFGDINTEKEINQLAIDLGDEVLFIMQGWDADKWYCPASWLLSLKAESVKSAKSCDALMSWLFPYADQMSVSCIGTEANYFGFGDVYPAITYIYKDNFLTVADDSLLLGWQLNAKQASIETSDEFGDFCKSADIKNPVAYVNWSLFKDELKEYMLYAADRTSKATPEAVEEKLFPLLDALKMKALIAGMDNTNKTIKFTFRAVK